MPDNSPPGPDPSPTPEEFRSPLEPKLAYKLRKWAKSDHWPPFLELLELHKQSALDGIRNLNAGKPTIDQIAARALGCSAILQEIEGLIATPIVAEEIIRGYEQYLKDKAESAKDSD